MKRLQPTPYRQKPKPLQSQGNHYKYNQCKNNSMPHHWSDQIVRNAIRARWSRWRQSIKDKKFKIVVIQSQENYLQKKKTSVETQVDGIQELIGKIRNMCTFPNQFLQIFENIECCLLYPFISVRVPQTFSVVYIEIP